MVCEPHLFDIVGDGHTICSVWGSCQKHNFSVGTKFVDNALPLWCGKMVSFIHNHNRKCIFFEVLPQDTYFSRPRICHFCALARIISWDSRMSTRSSLRLVTFLTRGMTLLRTLYGTIIRFKRNASPALACFTGCRFISSCS